ncbi:MAG TPA: DUF72 domain-containing protein, partial [Thermodesulfovibrionales bacterium]|nr:DUF72 domain-containing protein [Thermodesulfovibrionales bacterium]
MPTLNIGCSGFSYDDWKGIFYPEHLQKKRWLEYYAEKFSTVELNVTFYRLPEKETFTRWYSETPPGFLFSVKGSRFITHVKKLKACEEPLNVFFSRVSALRDKLGVILWQLPPGLRVDPPRLADFLELLKPHDVRSAFEFREETWITKKVISLIEKGKASLCMADWPPFLDELPVPANFVYMRRHGVGGNYASSYTREQLKGDAARIRKYLKQGKDVFIYFNNDASGYAPANAGELLTLLKNI